MNQKPSSNACGFAAMGCAIVALRFVPAETASDVLRVYGWIGAGSFAMAAAVLAVQSIRAAEARPSPWPSMVGRIAWRLRPRSFVIAWGVIAVLATTIGTPHLAISYPPRSCLYAGWAGVVPARTADCPWWAWHRRGDQS